jgi:hypothetical protein
MIYIKGGAAFVPVKANVVDTCVTIAAGCGNWQIATFSNDDTATVGTIGAASNGLSHPNGASQWVSASPQPNYYPRAGRAWVVEPFSFAPDAPCFTSSFCG